MNKAFAESIERAVGGDGACMDRLIQQVQPRLRAYILRCTLDEGRTDDILQETMLQMVKSLKTLKEYKHFWPWLYRIASSKIAGHFRKESRHSAIRFSALEDHIVDSILEDSKTAFGSRSAMRELHGLVLQAIEKLNPVQRSVFSLRCFEDFSYDEIADSVGCEASTARVHFFRARQVLKSALKRQGISGGAVVPAVVLFGKLTACEKTLATGITVSSINFSSGLTAAQTVIAAVKAGFVKTSIAAGAVAATVVLGHTAWVNTHPHPYPVREQVQSVHYTVQGIGLVDENKTETAQRQAARSRKGDVDIGPYYSKGAFEQWLQFPDGPDGPVFVRMQRWSIDGKEKQCGWLQNERANYYYNSGEKRVYITNDPIGMLILPTDPPDLSKFLMKYAKYQDRIKCSYDRKTGLIKRKVDNRVPSVRNYKTDYAYNSLTDQDFERFWPENAGVVDEQDTMHRRGWTYFTIEGSYNGQPVTGRGRLPFNYEQYKENKPWLHLTVGSDLEILDTPEGAVVIFGSEEHRSAYPPETFFTGFGRPWCGIRAYDTTRRDAAKQRIPFSSGRQGETGIVVVMKGSERIQYSIDMLADVIESVTLFDSQNNTSGQLVFNYAQELEDLGGVFEMPMLPEWAAREPVLRPNYGIFALLENNITSNVQLARQ